jgi:hypothetical protein
VNLTRTITLDDALTQVARDVLSAGGKNLNLFQSQVDPKVAQITVFRPYGGRRPRSYDDAWAIAVTAAGSNRHDIEDKGDHLKVPVLVADDVQVHTVNLIVQYGVHADVLVEEAPDPVLGLIPAPRTGETHVIAADVRALADEVTL